MFSSNFSFKGLNHVHSFNLKEKTEMGITGIENFNEFLLSRIESFPNLIHGLAIGFCALMTNYKEEGPIIWPEVTNGRLRLYLQLTIGETYSLNTKGSTFDAHTAAAKHIKQEGEHFLEFKLNIGFTVPFKCLSNIRPHRGA